jgi:signal transduction histidine kinase
VARLDQVRLKRLAESIDALADKDQDLLSYAREMAGLRRRAASELHSICAEFVGAINRLLSRSEVTLDPALFPEEAFQEEGVHLLQIASRGRILQIEFAATPELVSTEDFRIPYTIQGSVRAFNQQLLEKDLIEEQLVFYTVERHKRMWRFFDARTYRSGPFDQDYLVGLMEQLL